MRVLFINPPNIPFSEKSLLIEPIDILTAATYVKSLGHHVSVIDMDVKKMYPDEIKKINDSFKPQVTIIPFDYHIPLHTSNAVEGIYKIIDFAKDIDSKVIICGKTSKYYPEMFLSHGADVIIQGEIELILQELLSRKEWSDDYLRNIKGIAYKNNSQIVITEPETRRIDLNELPIADRRLVDLSDYIDVRSILSSRGCSGTCSFCPTPDFWGKWRGRNAVGVVDEIEYLVKETGAKKILFLDDNATVDRERMKEIANEIIKRGIKASFGCLGSIPTYDKEMITSMHKAGFRWIHYGIESGSQELLNRQSKHFDIEYAKKVIKETKEIGLRVRTSFILDLPGVDEDAVQKTNDFILQTQPDEIRLHYLSIRVGTKIFEDSQNKSCLPSQYIHSDTPVNVEDEFIKERILEGTRDLIDKLSQKGYAIITDVAQFRDFNALSDTSNSIRFVSFCPSQYGINWRNAA